MTHCSRCEAENGEDARFCGSCGGRMEKALDLAPPEPPPPEFPAMRGMIPSFVHAQQPEHLNRSAMHAVALSSPAQIANASATAQFAVGKDSAVSTVLCLFFPGGGQFYNGDIKKGFAIFAIAIVASCLTLYAGAWYLGVPLSIGAWVWAIIDARKVARRQKSLW